MRMEFSTRSALRSELLRSKVADVAPPYRQ